MIWFIGSFTFAAMNASGKKPACLRLYFDTPVDLLILLSGFLCRPLMRRAVPAEELPLFYASLHSGLKVFYFFSRNAHIGSGSFYVFYHAGAGAECAVVTDVNCMNDRAAQTEVTMVADVGITADT